MNWSGCYFGLNLDFSTRSMSACHHYSRNIIHSRMANKLNGEKIVFLLYRLYMNLYIKGMVSPISLIYGFAQYILHSSCEVVSWAVRILFLLVSNTKRWLFLPVMNLRWSWLGFLDMPLISQHCYHSHNTTLKWI